MKKCSQSLCANRLKRIFHYFPLVALFLQKSVAFWKYTNIGDRNRDSWVNDSHRETDRSRDTDADTDTDIDRDSLWNRHRHRHSQRQRQKQRRRDTTPSIHIVLFQYVTKCVDFLHTFIQTFATKTGNNNTRWLFLIRKCHVSCVSHAQIIVDTRTHISHLPWLVCPLAMIARKNPYTETWQKQTRRASRSDQSSASLELWK